MTLLERYGNVTLCNGPNPIFLHPASTENEISTKFWSLDILTKPKAFITQFLSYPLLILTLQRVASVAILV